MDSSSPSFRTILLRPILDVMKRSVEGKNGPQHPPTGKQVLQDSEPSFPLTLYAPVSPPKAMARNKKSPNNRTTADLSAKQQISNKNPEPEQDLAAIEAGEIEVTDYLGVFSARLSQCARPLVSGLPRLPIKDWVELYQRNQHPKGRHFVVHQHDHPIAGPHYDLRLQFSETSSVSWSIMYGLPGDPNSRRLNRNATETRVHCLWNHLLETASARTGSMIIWDTGEYEILPSQKVPELLETDDSRSEVSDASISLLEEKADSEKLREAFKNGKIRLRLHGTRLPEDYTIILRLDKNLPSQKPSATTPRKRRRRTVHSTPKHAEPSTTSDSNSPSEDSRQAFHRKKADASPAGSHSDSDSTIDHQIRLNNAYPGATNTIGSIHQRRWFATFDRTNSGFVAESPGKPGRKTWVRKRGVRTGRELGSDAFYVRGPDVERSVVTGRLGRDVLEDESVEGFVSRRGWRAVLE
ncbi:uncharacterized protein ACLA_047610 [Aspergillus clavatus NRRL 1]|uniref:DNA ligase D 3'-phosphoesterase domain-containing protein n=1 Tax=Aspergillus clavatus (strain ATCC 1007 / CBS 513.65 / DSM 816 / NCTC 3887 / NRRL 1 / QM 1276 / 107) TaxID=344612 RepID=A1CHD7_ASPCL|nr:uncharacterized protein ACLA_047610 [Aspergillus clavatus NRRL 1]EAW10292.1 conserved hypothetical protein [Aspergillus clavatus NRRL 1]